MGVSDLLDKRLIFVTRQGAVGKSTVAAALGMVAARRGLASTTRKPRRSGAFAEWAILGSNQ